MYKAASENDVLLVKKFREAFVTQNRALADEVFVPEKDFGLHCGGSLTNYIDKEMEEFHQKCEKFGMVKDGPLGVYRLQNDALYFYFGNDCDEALFEATWFTSNDRLIGNQSKFRWEPKQQWIKSVNADGVSRSTNRRVVNIKSLKDEVNIEWWRQSGLFEVQNSFEKKMDMEEVMGGRFLACGFETDDINGLLSVFRVKTSDGDIETQSLCLRGADHPLFEENQWPEVDFKSGVVTISELTKMVVILTVETESGQEMLKYPVGKKFDFGGPIKKICMTDGLSYDWIVELKEKT